MSEDLKKVSKMLKERRQNNQHEEKALKDQTKEDILRHLAKSLVFVAKVENKLQESKERLALTNDFNLVDAFSMFSFNQDYIDRAAF